MPRLNENLFLRTLLVVALVGILVVGATTYVLRTRIKSSIHEEAIRDAAAIAEHPIMEVIGPQDLAQPIEGPLFQEVDELVHTWILVHGVEQLKLWSPDGTLVYSSEPEEVGESHRDRDPLVETLEGGTAHAVVSKPENAQGRGVGEQLELYIPLTWRPRVVAGVLEVYLPHAAYAAQINSQTRDIVLVAGLTSLALAGALYLLYRTGWRAIREERDFAVRQGLERQHAEEALQESEALYRSLFDNAPVGIRIADLEGNLIAFNDAMLQPSGYTREDIAKVRNVAELYLDPTQRDEVLALAEKQGFLNQYEVRFKRKDGTAYDALLSLTSVTIGGRKCWLVVVEDFTEHNLLHEQLLQAQKMEVVGQLAGGIAHDFNNLLTPILGYSEMAAGEIASDHPVRGYLDQVSFATQRASALTQRLLTFSRRQVAEPRLVNLNDLVLGTDRILRHSVGDDIEPASLPAPALGVVRVDPRQMEQVLLNLAVNARDAMPNGGKLTIETANFTQDPESIQELAGLAPGLYVKLSISDTGVGMDKEVKSHLFEPFFTTKGPGKGTGLGLATCFGIVKGSGGEIRVHSKAGQGSTFEVYLPRVEGEADQVAGPGDSGELPRGMETVLLAEDDPSVRFLTAEVLRRQGYAVLEAEDGEKTAGRPRARQGRYSPAVDRRGHAPDGRHRAKQAAANYAPRDQGAFHFKIRRRRRRAKWWIGC